MGLWQRRLFPLRPCPGNPLPYIPVSLCAVRYSAARVSTAELPMTTMNTPEVAISITAAAVTEVQKFMSLENVAPEVGGLRVSVQPGGCSGFKYSLLIEDKAADDDTILPQQGFNIFVDPFSMQYLNGVMIDFVSSMQGSGFTFKNPNASGGCGCGSSFTA